MKNLKVLSWFLIFILSWHLQSSAGLAEGSLIATVNGPVLIQELKVGDRVISYKTDGSLMQAAVTKIIQHRKDILVRLIQKHYSFIRDQYHIEIRLKIKTIKGISMKHCCALMTDFLQDPRIPISYIPHLREYYMPMKGTSTIQGIVFCPWCGSKLPKDLRDEFFDIFYDELKLRLVKGLGTLETPGLPEEFKTDEWWKKRGL